MAKVSNAVEADVTVSYRGSTKRIKKFYSFTKKKLLKLGETIGEIEMYLLICEKRRKKKNVMNWLDRIDY
jgi:hypothetical protein